MKSVRFESMYLPLCVRVKLVPYIGVEVCLGECV